jgi:hypothetical protein
MKSNASAIIDPTILPEQARRELHDFYRFLVGKYAKRRTQAVVNESPTRGTAKALYSSPIVGIWKDRNLDDSAVFARSLRDLAQKRKPA